MAAHSRLLSWRVPRAEEPGGPQSAVSQSRTPLKRLTAMTPLQFLLLLSPVTFLTPWIVSRILVIYGGLG